MLQKTDKIWADGKLLNWDDVKVHVLTPSLHYGDAVFEGIRFYDTDRGPAIFRLKEHVDRFFYSAETFGMKIPFSKEQVFNAIVETVRVNKIKEGYIRPIAIFGYGSMGLKHQTESPVHVYVAVWPWGAYLGESLVRIKTSSFIRIHPKSVRADAKISGYYINSIFASLEAKKAGYDEALLLDYEGNIAEGPGENFFIVKNNALITPPLKGQILPGITRDSVIKIAKDLGISVEERNIGPSDAYSADEAFFTGTAAEITGIREIDDKTIGKGKGGSVTEKIKSAYIDSVHGKNKRYESWLTYAK